MNSPRRPLGPSSLQGPRLAGGRLMAKKKKRRETKKRKPAPSLPEGLLRGLYEAERLMRSKQLVQAQEKLEALDHRYPRRLDVLLMLSEVSFDLHDYATHLSAAKR